MAALRLAYFDAQVSWLFLTKTAALPSLKVSHTLRSQTANPKSQPVRKYSASVNPIADKNEPVMEVKVNEVKEGPSLTEISDPVEEDLYRERYIPITRTSIVRHILEEKNLLSFEEKKIFTKFANILDSAIVNKYHGILTNLKDMFDPLNPDKDTIQTRKWNRNERLDNEFWLIQQLVDVMERANFHELPNSMLEKAMREHDVNVGVKVSIDSSKFDVLRIWALGKIRPPLQANFLRKIQYFVFPKTKPQEPTFFKRVVLALRTKKDQKLVLKTFKEVPVNSLEMLLPGAKIKIGDFDKTVLVGGVLLTTVSLTAKAVTIMADMNVNSMLGFAALTGSISAMAWWRYQNRVNRYLVELNKLLYDKNIANNRGVLALIVDRAEDESFKEALLVYTFLLTARPSSLMKAKQEGLDGWVTPGGLNDVQLRAAIERWLQAKVGSDVYIEIDEAVKILSNLGILSIKDDKYFVLPMDAAMRNLPENTQTIISRALETDLAEGYDHDG